MNNVQSETWEHSGLNGMYSSNLATQESAIYAEEEAERW